MRAYLDIREINGYTMSVSSHPPSTYDPSPKPHTQPPTNLPNSHYTPFHPADSSPTIRTLVYIGTPTNSQFTGPQDPQTLAEHIYKSAGPSGPNKDYLLSLEAALDGLSRDSEDEHVTDLANRLRQIEAQHDAKVDMDQLSSKAVEHELRKAGNTEASEETEKK